MRLRELIESKKVPLSKEYAKGRPGQSKHSDGKPKAEPGRSKHPFHGKLVGG